MPKTAAVKSGPNSPTSVRFGHAQKARIAATAKKIGRTPSEVIQLGAWLVVQMSCQQISSEYKKMISEEAAT